MNKRFENKDDAIECIWEGFMGWDFYEIFDLVCNQIKEMSDVSDIPNKEMLIKSLDESLRIISDGKRSRLKVVNEMRDLWKTGEYTNEQLSKLFDLPEDTVCSVVTNKTLYDEEYQMWIDKKDVSSLSYCDRDGKWKMTGNEHKQKINGRYMTGKGLNTTVQESKGKFTTPIPTSIISLLGIEEGNKLNWILKDNQICIKVIKS